MADSPSSERDLRAEAFSRIGRSDDGLKHLLPLLYETLQTVTPPHQEAGAVQRHEGRRSFALELIEKLERENTSDRTAGNSVPGRPGAYRARGARRPVDSADQA